MPINLIAGTIAWTCERSAVALGMMRRAKFRGRWRIFSRIRPEYLPAETSVQIDGVNFHLRLNDYVQREIFFGIYEEEELAVALSCLKPGDVALDIGANIGYFSLHFARRVGAEGAVHSFEPDPDVHAQLLRNRSLNGFATVIVPHQLAVADSPGQMAFHRSSPENAGWGSLAKFGDIPSTEASVKVTTLDEFAEAQKLAKVALLKVDVEAYEVELLRGAQKCLQRKLFDRVLIEFNGPRLADRGKTLAEFLEPFLSNGYRPVQLNVETLEKLKSGAADRALKNFLFAAS
jgi:FkbM family methyltransferase